MKYVINFAYNIKESNYYSGSGTLFGQVNTQKLSEARIYCSKKEAQKKIDIISEAWLASIIEVSDKELFEARLKGI